jgi:signal transduction histidine kinase/ActR/RegA family two-component response regulator
MIELFNRAAADEGIQLEWVYWQESPEILMQARKADLLFLAVMTPERRRDFHLTEPWLRIDGQLIWRKGQGELGVPALRGRRIGVPGYRLYEEMARKHFSDSETVRRTSRLELLEMVCSGNLDAAIIDSRSISMYLLERPRSCVGVPLGMDLVEEHSNDIAVMSTPEAKRAAESIRAGISRLGRDGTMHQIYQKWGVGFLPEVKQMDEMTETRRDNSILLVLLAGSALLLALVALLLLKLRRAARLAGQASAAKGTFLATMSHETRTPLNGIIGLAEALGEEPLTAEQRQMAGSIAQCGRNLVALVNDVLDYSKLEAGKMEIVPSSFSLREMIQPIAVNMGSVARQKGLGFDVSLAPEVADWVTGDPLRLAQVLFNLLGNAVKFTEKGAVELHVRPDGELIRFEVRDTGIGMTAEECRVVFQAFWQAEQSTTRKFGGTGLGLCISKRIVEKMGGRLTVESRKGAGSAFAFALPLPESAVPVRAPEPVAAVEAGPVLRILFADDNLVNQRVIERMLWKLGHQVTVVSHGAEAVEHYERGTFDCVLMDCHMPVEDGFSATARIRKLETGKPRTPILALTALAFAEDRARCLASGMDTHLVKPVSLRALDEAIRSYCTPANSKAEK